MPVQAKGEGVSLVPTHLQPQQQKGVGGQHHAPANLSPKKDPVPIEQEASLVWKGTGNLPQQDSIPETSSS